MNGAKQIIRNHPFFHGMKPEHLDLIVSGASDANFAPGDLLLREGAPANQFYLIVQGQVALQAHDPANGTALVQNLGAGEVLGWSWLFPPFVWHFTARAVEPTQAVIINGAHLLINAERDHDFGYELMKRVAQMVIHRLQATRKQLLALQIDAALDG